MQWRISSLVKAFASPVASFGDLDADTVATLIAAASDIALILDAEGTVQDMSFQNEELSEELPDSSSWIGRKLTTCVAPDSRPKVAALLRDAEKGSEVKSRWRHLNHLREDGKSVPVLYCAVQAGEGERIVVFGRDLRALSVLQQKLMSAQESLERDYSRLRETEMRYRLLFQMSSEALLIFDAAKLRTVDANPAARTILGMGENASGLGVGDIFAAESIDAVQGHLNAARLGVRVDDITAFAQARRCARGGCGFVVQAGEREPLSCQDITGAERACSRSGPQAQVAQSGGECAGRVRGDRRCRAPFSQRTWHSLAWRGS